MVSALDPERPGVFCFKEVLQFFGIAVKGEVEGLADLAGVEELAKIGLIECGGELKPGIFSVCQGLPGDFVELLGVLGEDDPPCGEPLGSGIRFMLLRLCP